MDPGSWPNFIWLAIALAFAAFVSSILVLTWNAIFRRRRGWMLDSALLGASGFLLVGVMLGYLFLSNWRVSKKRQELLGYVVLLGAGSVVSWASRKIRNQRPAPKENSHKSEEQ